MKEVTIGKFMSDFYLSALEKFVYHIYNVKILSKPFCGAKRRTTFMRKPSSLLTVRDYAERLSASFDLEIQSNHFGNGRSLSIEGCSVELSMNNSISRLQIHSHFSDDSRQDGSSTNPRMMKMMDQLKLNNQEISGCTVWKSTDGCSKQYRCGSALYFLSYISIKYKMIIDRMIGAPGHGKDLVDGINAIDTRYLKGKMCMIGTPEVNYCSKRIKSHSMIDNARYIFAEECKRLCECSERQNGAKVYSKYKKCEAKYKVKQRFYYVQTK